MKRLILATTVATLALMGCKKEKEVVIETPEPTKQAFVPEKSGQITTAQMQRWLNVNRDLDKLTLTYSDSLATKDATQYARYKTVFAKRQDSLCVAAGLTGGHEEYSWITKQMGSPINSPLLDSLKLVAK